MQISIFGLGYVGSVSAACLARNGHEVIGVDPDRCKVDLINQGASPIIEPGLRELLATLTPDGRLEATRDPDYAVLNSAISFICVGTPSNANGSLNLDDVRRVSEQIGNALAEKTEFHVVVARSTMLPGTVRSLVIPALEQFSRKRAGVDFGVCVNPEFLREGTAIYDYDNPPKTVAGATDPRSLNVLKSLYANLNAPFLETPIEVAEAVKYTDNAWHAVKVNFANEIGAIFEKVGVDGQAVMDVFCEDQKLNISTAYLRPGLAFGGSCLPKDVRALTHFARALDVDVPMLNHILAANERQIERALGRIQSQKHRSIGILGLSFKAGTDDLRESPMVKIVEALHGRGYEIKIYDPYVSIASVRGANRAYIVGAIPHIHKMLTTDFQEFLAHSETIVIGNQSPLFRGLLKKFSRDRCIVDLVNLLWRRRRKSAPGGNVASHPFEYEASAFTKSPELAKAACA
jgi:GDP-mannose 6-dehydrogenase